MKVIIDIIKLILSVDCAHGRTAVAHRTATAAATVVRRRARPPSTRMQKTRPWVQPFVGGAPTANRSNTNPYPLSLSFIYFLERK
jgi:hypothetical protein